MSLVPEIQTDSPVPLVKSADGPGIAYGHSWSDLTFSDVLPSIIQFFSWLFSTIVEAFASKPEPKPLSGRITVENQIATLNDEIRAMEKKQKKGKDITLDLGIANFRLHNITIMEDKPEEIDVKLTIAHEKLVELNKYAQASPEN